ncbi:hypothetical protein GDO81_007819 [Engystomops pustulosus]|uniref:Small EDRK-rich factor-like N-terminal domain-containing protein n=1 Tax=Engystomops pustulosus TaxID=76066 RepID=A0AAV7CBL3_ENGPU|nr:hypothetical protein GDO81_007819 [Engystomops pustulosus]
MSSCTAQSLCRRAGSRCPPARSTKGKEKKLEVTGRYPEQAAGRKERDRSRHYSKQSQQQKELDSTITKHKEGKETEAAQRPP